MFNVDILNLINSINLVNLVNQQNETIPRFNEACDGNRRAKA